MKAWDQGKNKRPKQKTDNAQKQEAVPLLDAELDAVAGGTTNFETAAGKAFLQGFMRTSTSK